MDTWEKDYLSAFPGWSYRLWTESDIRKLNLVNQKIYRRYKKSRNSMKWAGMADIARYEILYRFGGIYIDADSIWVNGRSLDSLCTECFEAGKGLFAAREPKNKYVANGVIGAIPGQIGLEKIIRILPRRCRNQGLKMPYISVGPLLFNKVREEMMIFPSRYFYPVYWHKNIMGPNKIELTTEDYQNMCPESYMYQFGYTTRELAKVVRKKIRQDRKKQEKLEESEKPEKLEASEKQEIKV